MVNNLDALYGALADPTRREMVSRLRDGRMSVSELGAPYGMTLAAVGKHVAVLESAGIVRTTKVGRVRSCTLVPHGLSAAATWIDEQERFGSGARSRPTRSRPGSGRAAGGRPPTST